MGPGTFNSLALTYDTRDLTGRPEKREQSEKIGRKRGRERSYMKGCERKKEGEGRGAHYKIRLCRRAGLSASRKPWLFQKQLVSPLACSDPSQEAGSTQLNFPRRRSRLRPPPSADPAAVHFSSPFGLSSLRPAVPTRPGWSHWRTASVLLQL